MKKFLIALITLSILCTMMFSVSAETETGVNIESDPKEEIDVTATSDGVEPVYSVDISWGSMAFTYAPKNLEWNPNTLKYEENTESASGSDAKGVWSCEEGANEITVVNKSNVPVNVEVAFARNEGISAFTNIEGTFEYQIQTTIQDGATEAGDVETHGDPVTLEEVQTEEKAITYGVVFTLNLTGNVSDLSAFDDTAKIGTVTVTLNKVTAD